MKDEHMQCGSFPVVSLSVETREPTCGDTYEMLTEDQVYVSMTDGTFVELMTSHQLYTDQLELLYLEWLQTLKEYKKLEFDLQMGIRSDPDVPGPPHV